MLAFSVFGADMHEPVISNPESRIRDWRFTENDILEKATFIRTKANLVAVAAFHFEQGPFGNSDPVVSDTSSIERLVCLAVETHWTTYSEGFRVNRTC